MNFDVNDLLSIYTISPSLIVGCIISVVVIATIPKCFRLRALNGLFYAQLTFALNSFAIVAGYVTEIISIESLCHFYLIEISFLACACFAYTRITKNKSILNQLEIFFTKRESFALFIFLVGLSAFYFITVPTDGSSRIAFMTSRWYSLIKPTITILLPLCEVGVIICLKNRNLRTKGYILLFLVICSSVFSGSKASFTIALISAYLFVCDLSPKGGSVLGVKTKVLAAALIMLSIPAALIRLNVSGEHMFSRVFLTADATIMVYFSDDPTEASKGVSMGARMHRGFARLLGDPSAKDVDTLFGYALNKIRLGANTMTGPNARLAPYFRCNFPGYNLIYGITVIFVFFGLIAILTKCLNTDFRFTAVAAPYIFRCLVDSSQDFNILMMSITYLIALATIPPTLISLKRGKGLLQSAESKISLF